jgi:CheY-like chemotaxis protein
MKKVLLASASKAFLSRNTNLLMHRGLRLFTTSRGEDALRMHEDTLFDLILSDLELEDMGGCTLCSQVRSGGDSASVPVILTCLNIADNLERVEKSGASAMLLKPVDPLQLLETVARFIDLPIGAHKRVVLNVKVTVRDSSAVFFCLSEDISTTGILLMTEYHLELGSRITCQFILPGSLEIEATGEVVRSMSTLKRRTYYGVKFGDIPLSCRRAIADFVASSAQPAARGDGRPPQAPSHYPTSPLHHPSPASPSCE